MSSRISSASLCLLLAACGGGEPTAAPVNQAAPAPVATAAPGAERVACAADGAPFRDDCTVERVGDAIVIRHPDGGFRRLRVDDQGIVITADGAVAAQMWPGGEGMTEIVVGDMRYRLPNR